ncbi:hypothetical protein SCP_1003990 [Sparassis crispa]|uniref:HTH CENPB-type domain-containing protein n=1 Tax=Sparassis crispa TaxID=139825 RepID=A0A401GY77_9APHY|nr:hypothetical protein SCP_1003990 [Sparassis crispa]GBE87152.1 hypothetical protein SCP_1003990 [Sparassis crispa]
MPRAAVLRKKGLTIQNREAKIQQAVDGVKNGTYATPKIAACALSIGSQYTTIWRWLNNKTRPQYEAHQAKQLLNHAQERTLVAWTKWLGFTGQPVMRETISPKVKALCGKDPNPKWIERFLMRNPDCTMGRPADLDPKRASAFNYTTVNHHFEELQKTIDLYDIPPCNMFNFDEIGIQLGGGRKGSREQFFFASEDQSHYKLKSDDLELVTVLETVCADGSSTVKPGFVFAGVKMCEEWISEEDGIFLSTTDNGWTDDHVSQEWFQRALSLPPKLIVILRSQCF